MSRFANSANLFVMTTCRIFRKQYYEKFDPSENIWKDVVATYEIHIPESISCLHLELENDYYGKHVRIKTIFKKSCLYALQPIMQKGHYLVSINGIFVLDLSFKTVKICI